jgi:hypothetical protein
VTGLNPEIGSDIPPAAAEVEPPATASLVTTGGSADIHILLGMIASAMMQTDYVPVDVDRGAGNLILRNIRSGNAFRVSVVQLEGTE